MTTPAPEVVTLGESMGLFFAPSGMQLASRPPFHLSFGGAETNVAIGLTRLGHSAAWVGRLGDDEIGRFIDRELRAEGVRTSGLFGPRHTGLMVRTSQGFGRTSVQYTRLGSAGSCLDTNDVPLDDIRSAKVLHLTGITAALGDSPLQAMLLAARTARESGVLVSLDLNYRASLWDAESARPVLEQLVSLADLVFATTDEASILLGNDASVEPRATSDVDVAKRISALGPKHVVVKRGAEGAVALHDDFFEQEVTRVTEIDPVGAGDAFAAGYLHGVLIGSDPQTCLDFAGRVAAHSVTVIGDWEGLPRLGDLTADSRDILR